MVTIYRNVQVITDGQILKDMDVFTEDGVIVNVLPRCETKTNLEAQVIDLNNCYLAPGFIDLHCHGGAGYEFVDGTEEAVIETCAMHAKNGTRVLYPTISAMDFETIFRALETIERVKEHCALEIPGVHLEGPYLDKEYCGGQDSRFIRPPQKEEYTKLLDRFGSLISRWTYAPEHDDGAFLDELNARGVKASIGHSSAEYDVVQKVFDKGCRLITHLYSCTSTITRHKGFRHLGIIESAYLLDDMYVEAIGDGCHLPPELMRLIVKLKGTNRVCMITDAIRHAGMENCDSALGGTESVPYVIEDGVAKLADRSAFAGSIATTMRLVKCAVDTGIPLAEAVRMLTETPAKLMGLQRKGCIAKGFDAQFTAFDKGFHIVAI